MKSTTTKFPDDIDSRLFFQDINIEQVTIMNAYHMFLNAGNYTRASDYLNNSEVFFYGAWLLNLLENRLYALGKYITNLEKNQLITYTGLIPSSDITYNGMNWIADNEMIEFGENYVDLDNNMWFGSTAPTDMLETHDMWIDTDNENTTFVDKDDIKMAYQENEPAVSEGDKFNIWVGGD